jgi:hypothetical protein
VKSLLSRSYSRDRGPGVPGAHFLTGLMSPNYLKWNLGARTRNLVQLTSYSQDHSSLSNLERKSTQIGSLVDFPGYQKS